MSFAASQARLFLLISMHYDLELQQQFILQHKLYLSKASGSLMNMKVEYEPGSKYDKLLEARIHQLNEAEKVLEVRMNNIKQRAQAVSTEREQLVQQISQNTQRTFKNAWG
jgi:hypothetical protein